ncbi:MAG: ligase-associated DNA damage response DEXH box helicase [Alphaproteobacteria bacterium]|nr:ligase-associated DNA damage response DEXH box helicase [Alphaproteobacteria bacterium]MBU2040405.1 ligase-associated DNA damage response DEXH box helicase [Alphaproteobacteria bacterium]MBU2125473.1 ligase-associated DNA damage response DEXH box helicase [Alphaproteobacteria bacterium]MBU2209036.1 ligase-associated DNA damage response DEXH box helicase [Alphaproteobacteria bacterium]MBU2291378.1 ligase-associated DNA damage response DEXH box helicase [Alphaproteobacteria bacterium]
MTPPPAPATLSPLFADWFASRGWSPRRHQLEMIAAAQAGSHALLVAPTGGGKTLAGFLPSLVELAERGPRPEFGPGSGVHTLYLSPLKALTTDVERNLMTPIREIGLNIHVESRTGDTKQSKKQRQRENPPDILLTTPEQLALFCAWDGARSYFADLKCVVLDEVHAIWSGKRGDLLSLGLGRLQQFAPGMRRVALSATVDDPEMIADWLRPGRPSTASRSPSPFHGEETDASGVSSLSRSDGEGDREAVEELSAASAVTIVRGDPGAPPVVDVLVSEGKVPWAGHTGQHAIPEVYEALKRSGMTLIFVNTRWQAEFVFQSLWAINDDDLPIALHHGSLAAEQRRKVEAAMARGELRAVVCTSTLDLGIDWGDVDLVIQLAAPKGASRLVQRIGRANHRLDDPSRALMVPASRFEMLECQAAREAVAENAFDWEPIHTGTLDTLAQHVMGCACSEPFSMNDLYAEVTGCGPYRSLSWEDFEAVVDLVATGGYALRTYERFARIVRTRDGKWKVRNAQTAQRHRMNVGTIVAAATLNVRIASRRGGASKQLIGGRKVGEAEETYFEQMAPGDTFVFAGQVWAFQGINGMDALVTHAQDKDPKIPSWGGSKFPMSTSLASRVRAMIQDRDHWRVLPPDVQEWLELQETRSVIPDAGTLLVETFPRGSRHFLVAYPFEGGLAHATLCMLLTRRLDRLGVGPLGFVCTDYSLAIWSIKPMDALDLGALFEPDMLGDDLESWLEESFMMKRTFRNCALISGLIEKRQPGNEKTGRQVTFSTDLIYDVLRRHQPDHLLLRTARADAAAGLLDVARLGLLLTRIRGQIRHVPLERPSPFCVPVLVQIGRERVGGGQAAEMILDASAYSFDEEALIAEVMADAPPVPAAAR